MNDLILLAALLEGPKHGWALKKLAGFLGGQNAMHNSLVYPLLKKFVAAGWVRRREEAGERGQRRSVYCLTLPGNRELMRRLREFGAKEASSPIEFRLRVGLFGIVDPDSRKHILDERARWLSAREDRFAFIQQGLKAMDSSQWGNEVVGFLLREVRAERKWIAALRKNENARPPSAAKVPQGNRGKR
jgi:DNA-binding PadR family transcriptional regulator